MDLDLLLVLADENATQEIAKGAVGIASECFSDRASLINKLKQIMQPGDRILCKASNSVGLNEVVEALIAEKSKTLN